MIRLTDEGYKMGDALERTCDQGEALHHAHLIGSLSGGTEERRSLSVSKQRWQGDWHRGKHGPPMQREKARKESSLGRRNMAKERGRSRGDGELEKPTHDESL